jgi:hypothetical protein
MAGDYIKPSEATKIRVHDEGFTWAIDAADDNGEYTEECWTYYNDAELDRESAIKIAPQFAAHIGRSDLADSVVVME